MSMTSRARIVAKGLPSGNWEMLERDVERGGRSPHHDDARELEEPRSITPEMDFAKLVEADEEEERSARLLFAERVERVDGIRHAATIELERRDGERGMVFDGEPEHLEAKRAVRETPSRLMRRVRRWHEEHAVEGQRFADLLGGPEMSGVNGIEGPAEDADPHVRI